MVIIILVLVLIFLAQSVWGVWRKNRLSQSARVEAEQDMAVVKERRDALELRVKRLETSRGQEEEIRRNFPVVKEGEQVIVIVSDDEAAAATTSEGWWGQFLKQFSN